VMRIAGGGCHDRGAAAGVIDCMAWSVAEPRWAVGCMMLARMPEMLSRRPDAISWNDVAVRFCSILAKCPESEIREPQRCRESAPYLVANPRQVPNLAAVRFASGTDFDTLAS